MVWFIVAAAACWLLLLVLGPLLPAPIDGVLYALGSLICHQRPDRSFELAGDQLPVCARCIGIYAGAVVGGGVALLTGQWGYPRTAVVLSLLPAVLSLVIEWTGMAQPGNVTRAATGMIAGGAIAAVVLATLHYERCAPPRPIAPNRPPTLT